MVENHRMLIKEKIGNLNSFNVGDRSIDRVSIEWYEANKRILHKQTQSGRQVAIRFINETIGLLDDDIIWLDNNAAIVISVLPCEAIIVEPTNQLQTASICYEIGNKHLPLFFINGELMVPYEPPLFNLLLAAGYNPKRENRKLLNQIKTTVSPHAQSGYKQSMFSKIMQLTASSPDA